MAGNKGKAAAGGAAGLAVAIGILAVLWGGQEGTELKAYQDSIGIWTICQGDTHNVTPGMVETPEGCAARSGGIVKASLEAADRLVTVDMTYGQWVAYADFIGNAGEANFRKSSMLRHANAGRLAASCEAFRLWVFAGGRDCRKRESNCMGLVTRREIERRYCMGELP